LSAQRAKQGVVEAVEPYFELLKELFAANDYSPKRIWNADETSLCTQLREDKILASKGQFLSLPSFAPR